MTNSPEYEAARKAHDVAYEAYDKISVAYHAMEIGDDEFMVGRKAYDDATAIFDVAYFAEQDRPEETPAPVEDKQTTMDFS